MKEERFCKVSILTRAEDEKQYRIKGIAIPYNTRTELFPGFFETVTAGSMTRTLKEDRQFLLFQHDRSKILADTSSGTLMLEDKDDGLYFEADLSTSESTRDHYELVKRGIVDSMSIGFTIKTEEYENDNDITYRTITEIDRLFEMSIVDFPAYTEGTIVELKKQVEDKQRRILSMRATVALNNYYLQEK